MAFRQFAMPLDSSSKQTGDITLKQLVDAGQPVEFILTNAAAGTLNQLNLITRKNGLLNNHPFDATIVDGKASVTLQPTVLNGILTDAQGGDWDYVEQYWTAGQVDVPSKSGTIMVQNGRQYDYIGWPPNQQPA